MDLMAEAGDACTCVAKFFSVEGKGLILPGHRT